jgi:hypothetical protein
MTNRGKGNHVVRAQNGDEIVTYSKRRKGNRYQKKELIPGETFRGRPAYYAYQIEQKDLPAPIKIRNGQAWWMNKTKVEKLVDAYRLDCTNREACFYAGITPHQLNHFLNKHPDFKDIISHCKEELGYYARKNVAKSIKIDRSVGRSWEYLSKKHKKEFSEQHDLTSDGKPLQPGTNAVVFMDFSKPDQTEPERLDPDDVEVIDTDDES